MNSGLGTRFLCASQFYAEARIWLFISYSGSHRYGQNVVSTISRTSRATNFYDVLPVICELVNKMLIEWSSSLVVGHELIDSEHEHIVRLINDYSDHITGNLSRDKQLKAYSEIVDCLSAHFIKEEQIMASHKYDNLGAHIKAHGGLFEKLTHMTFLVIAHLGCGHNDLAPEG